MEVPGTKVVRSKDWCGGDQDGTDSSGTLQIGTVVTGHDITGWVWVLWPNGASHPYRMGASGAYDLELAGE